MKVFNYKMENPTQNSHKHCDKIVHKMEMHKYRNKEIFYLKSNDG